MCAFSAGRMRHLGVKRRLQVKGFGFGDVGSGSTDLQVYVGLTVLKGSRNL